MERDSRRARGQWRGCHTFNNIVCDGDQVASSQRSGGLKMGQTYFYYYELDGSTETHDPSLPSTTACPYLPGQAVNTLDVPLEHQLRYRSASMNSLRITDYKTMDPTDKYMTPRPPPPPVSRPQDVRAGSSSSDVPKRSARSVSPPRWTGAARRFFGMRPQGRELERGRKITDCEVDNLSIEDLSRSVGTRSTTPSEGIRSRDMSPESLRRFLVSDDRPPSQLSAEPPRLLIPEDIVEECEDDDNFATSATSETAPITTLSPPPYLRNAPPSSSLKKDDSTATLVPQAAPQNIAVATTSLSDTQQPKPRREFKLNIPRSNFNIPTSSTFASPISTQSGESRDISQLSFFDDSDDEMDLASNADSCFDVAHSTRRSTVSTQDGGASKHARSAPFTGYSLPRITDSVKTSHLPESKPFDSPALVARNENGIPVGNTNLFTLPHIDAGLDDLANDMSWMADVIRPSKDI
ncbi:hypothetical protein F5Y15DRAFT_239484 [Xylariaceae sp. FL0016]|nr:hypothetical protein F5Y15DRAFT_239484 [Xylariaceae sp. FL0016]